MKKIPAWLWLSGFVVGAWVLSKPSAVQAGATAAATPATGTPGVTTATGTVNASGYDAGRMGGGGHGGHGGGHIHYGGGPRGFVGHSTDFFDYGQPVEAACDPRVSCGEQPILPCRCG